jgi:hypothetical protein
MAWTSARISRSTTAKTSSTVRPEASMRARIADLTDLMAAGRSDGGCSQCGSTGREAAAGADWPGITFSF